ncbi:hypothetical protein TcCL_ESM08237 [Trypanosoma cruzi]|nr:hypothetical protein TcCL_ESM08237 [Trypanosoma cruzi]
MQPLNRVSARRQQRTGTSSSSSSVIAVDRRRGVLHVCLPTPAPHRCVILPLRSVATAPCASSAAPGLLGFVNVALPLALLLTASSPVDCPTKEVTPSAATSSLSGRSLFFFASCGAPAVSLGKITPSPVVVPEATFFSSGDGCFWGIAVSTSFGGVPRPVSMLSATGTDAPGNPCSVDAGETVLLHTPSPRRPTGPLEVGYRWWRISCTPARGHGK